MRFVKLGCVVAVLSLSGCFSTLGMENPLSGLYTKFTEKFNPSPKPIYKVGQPYEIDGVTYYPKEDYKYSEIGLASWYGDDFNGGVTANGEIFDMNELTAAHKTLPLPSYVRVTNMLNGKNLVLRVNDRGPFVPGRIIDVSKRASEILGFRKTGVTQVRVEILAEDSIRLKEKMLGVPKDSSSMLDNKGGEGDDQDTEVFRETYNDNKVEYFPFYEDEVDEKQYIPDLDKSQSVYAISKRNEVARLPVVTPEQKVRDAVNQNVVEDAYKRREAFNNEQEEYVKGIEESMLSPTVNVDDLPLGQPPHVDVVPTTSYVTTPEGDVAYIPNPYYVAEEVPAVGYVEQTQQVQYVEQVPAIQYVEQPQPVYQAQPYQYSNGDVVVHEMRSLNNPSPDMSIVAPAPIIEPISMVESIKVAKVQPAVDVLVSKTPKAAPKAISGKYYVQAASFTKKPHADSLKSKIASTIDNVFVAKADVKGKTYYRVRIGPVADKSSAKAVAASLRSYGIKKPTIIKK